MVTFDLAPRTEELVDLARAVARRALAPRAAGYDADGAFPAENFTDLAEAGLLRLLVPVDQGGHGADFTTYALVVSELAEACGSTALIYGMHCGVSLALASSPSTAGAAILRDVVEHGRLFAWGFSEPGVGGNILAPQLTVTPEPATATVAVQGTKVFCTGAGHVDYYLINGTSGETAFRRSQTLVLVPADTPGLKVENTWDAMGMRANAANNLHLDCRLPQEAMIGGPCGGMGVLGRVLPALLLGLSATSLGVARAADAFARNRVNRRQHATTGAPLAGYQAVRLAVADMTAALHTSYLAMLHAAVAADRDPLDALNSLNLSKYVCNSAAIKVADTAMQLAGGNGYLRINPLERYYRDARAGAVMGANLDAVRDLIGRTALDLDPRDAN